VNSLVGDVNYETSYSLTVFPASLLAGRLGLLSLA
jgi:hypothetical protein